MNEYSLAKAQLYYSTFTGCPFLLRCSTQASLRAESRAFPYLRKSSFNHIIVIKRIEKDLHISPFRLNYAAKCKKTAHKCCNFQ